MAKRTYNFVKNPLNLESRFRQDHFGVCVLDIRDDDRFNNDGILDNNQHSSVFIILDDAQMKLTMGPILAKVSTVTGVLRSAAGTGTPCSSVSDSG